MSGFVASDIAALRGQVEALRTLVADPRPLLKAWGTETLRWIDETFKEGGRPAWAPLRPSTIAARREGGGAGGALPLQNNGALRSSFDIAELTTDHVAIESGNRTAIFHEFGTKGPYEIRAKNGKALAIPGSPYTLAGLGRARPTGRGTFIVSGAPVRGRKAGQAVAPHAKVTFRKKVIHPGLPARPMLPLPEQIAPRLERVGQKVIDLAVSRKAGAGGR